MENVNNATFTILIYSKRFNFLVLKSQSLSVDARPICLGVF
jgi:hypothetical protein